MIHVRRIGRQDEDGRCIHCCVRSMDPAAHATDCPTFQRSMANDDDERLARAMASAEGGDGSRERPALRKKI